MAAQLDLFDADANAAALAIALRDADQTPEEAEEEPGDPMPSRIIPPRPYQARGVDAVFDSWEENDSCILIAATGTGKTAMAAHVARRCIIDPANDVLFFVHRDEIIRQTLETMRSVCWPARVEVEVADEFSCVDPARGTVPRIVVASKDTLWKPDRLARFGPDRFGTVIIDEAHHATRQNKTYWHIIEYFRRAKRLGITATPDRADEVQLGRVFGSVAMSYDALTAIREGWLVPIVQAVETVEGYDLSEVRSQKGDLHPADLAATMVQDRPLHAVASLAVKYSNYQNSAPSARPTLVFCASVPHAFKVAEILNNWHAEKETGAAAAVWSKAKGLPSMDKDTRREIIARFKRGDIRYLCNFNVLTEGFDAPETRCVVIARPTESRAAYAQMVGRVTRPHPSVVGDLNACRSPSKRRALIKASLKPGGLVVDLAGVSGRHKLVTCADILGGYDDLVASRAAKSIAGKGTGDVASALEEAARQVERESQERQRAIQEAAERERTKGLLVRAVTTTRIVDPFDTSDAPIGLREPGWMRGRRATDRQKSALEKAGYDPKDVRTLSMFQASALLDKMARRREEGKCTLAQSRLLAKHGHDPESSFDDARRIIDGLASRWRSKK